MLSRYLGDVLDGVRVGKKTPEVIILLIFNHLFKVLVYIIRYTFVYTIRCTTCQYSSKCILFVSKLEMCVQQYFIDQDMWSKKFGDQSFRNKSIDYKYLSLPRTTQKEGKLRDV